MKLRLVKITWLDHVGFTENTWREPEDVINLKPILCQTVGWVLKETKKAYHLVSTIATNSKVCGDFVILKGTIKKVKQIE
jgi:hypothetical protein